MAETKTPVMDWDHDEHWVPRDGESVEPMLMLPPRRVGSLDTDLPTARLDPYARGLAEIGVPLF